MPLKLENTCPECDGWKGEDYDVCRDCATEERERQQEPVGIAFHTRRTETLKAVLFEITPGFMGQKVWIPKSVLLSEGRDLTGEQRFYVPAWFAEKEDLA
jgi:hypothetical protein